MPEVEQCIVITRVDATHFKIEAEGFEKNRKALVDLNWLGANIRSFANDLPYPGQDQ